MAKTLRPHRWWGITYINGNDVMPDTIRRTRKESQDSVSRGSSTWDYWKRHGCRSVRVTVIVEIAAAPKLAGEEGRR